MNTNDNKNNRTVKNIESFPVVYPNAAGIDVGAGEHWVSVPPDRDSESVRQFGAFTCDLHAIGDWLIKCSVDSVAMEATGVYWIPLFQILEAKGIEVNLINARHIKCVPCRAKTDRLDCQWIRKLHTCGLLTPSFRPKADMCKIRTLMRHRDQLIKMKVQCTQRMQKSLELMNIKLTEVISEITGLTGMRIIRSILQGQRDPTQLAVLKDHRIHASVATLTKALEGDYREEHLFTLQQSLDSLEFFENQISQCDQKIEAFLRQLNQNTPEQQLQFDFDKDQAQTDTTNTSTTPKPKKAHGNAPTFDVQGLLQKIAKVDLMSIPGIKESALTIISEIGLDMSKWKTAQHFTSWLGLAPNRKISGGKVLSDKIPKVCSRINRAFRNAASSLRGCKSYLGAFYRKIQARSGPACAIVATARKLAVIVYHMLKKQSEYVELGEKYLIQIREKKILKNIEKQAKLLGYSVTLQKVDA